MARQLIECVPNFSEGRRAEVIEALVSPFRDRSGCHLFDYRADRDHNRLVASLVGEPDPVQDALLEAARVALEHIDMETHEGGHPRIGAVDVIPFIPLRNIDMSACVELARDFGRRYHEATKIPVYYYEEAATMPERRGLEAIRKGQYETLKAEVALDHRRPDVGPPALHPSAGATVIGARKFLVAYNINLRSPDLSVARAIAGALRAAGGGLGHVKAIGLELQDRGMVQVSVNVVDYEKNPLYRVTEFVRAEARRWGVEVAETEIYGMVPTDALLHSAAYYLQTAGFDSMQCIEMKLLEMLGEDGR